MLSSTAEIILTLVSRPPAPATTSVDDIIRRAMLYAAEGMGISKDIVMNRYLAEEGYGTIPDALTGIERRHQLPRGAVVDRYAQRMRQHIEIAQGAGRLSMLDLDPIEAAAVALPHAAREALHLVPDVEFLTAIEAAHRGHVPVTFLAGQRRRRSPVEARPSLLDRVDHILETHGLPFRASGDTIEWVGEPVLREAAIEPALRALEHPLLANARALYEEAARQRRRGHPKALETSLLDSGKAVEATLKALLIAHGHDLPRNETAVALWGRVVAKGLIPGMWEHTVLAASGPRNRVAHPSEDDAPPVTEYDAELAVGAAGLAISLLGAASPRGER
jgi:hypothetical protein